MGKHGRDEWQAAAMDLTGISTCIFDVNGVFIDSNQANAQAMADAFSPDPAVQQQIVRVYLGLTGIDRGGKLREIQNRVIRRPFGPGEFELRWQRFGELKQASMLGAELLPGAMAALRELGRRGIVRAALSNTPLDELREVLAHLGLAGELEHIRGGGDWPKVESLGQLLLDLKVAPGECLFVGDGRGDLAAARAHGVPFVALDPGTGEFDGETGFAGPFAHLDEWLTHLFR